jgi:long-chain acyl-CoA synthetase
MTHPRLHAAANPAKLAVVMADGSGALTYGELERRANAGAHLLRLLGIANGQTIAFWLPNEPGVFEVYWAAQRAGLYITPIATSLTTDEAGYILENAGARLVVGSPEVAGYSLLEVPAGVVKMSLDEWRERSAGLSDTPIADEAPGFHMVYSSGTTGRPKGVRLALPTGQVADLHQLAQRASQSYGIGPDSVYLSPAPLYHTAPLAFTTSCHRLGATVVQMRKFDAEAALDAIARFGVTVVQMVPTMFVRLLKLPTEARSRYDLGSLELVIHAAAPCPVAIKQQMLDWLGPIITEYYGGSEGAGSTMITAEEWLTKPGSVGRAAWTSIHICDDAGEELPPGSVGTIYFEGGSDFRYLGDDAKTRDSRHRLHPGWATLGDVGYVDADGYLFLTDRKSYMIISGGVNIYPQEVEDLLIGHRGVADAAVIGVPDPEFGEAVKAVVQPLDPADASPEFALELIDYCKARLSPIKCPRTIDFDPALPRLDNGKLYKRLIKQRYWPAEGATI